MRDEHIIAALFDQPWAIVPEKLRVMQAVALRHLRGELLSAEQVEAIVAAAPRQARMMTGAVAVLPVFGVIAQRMNLMSMFSGGTSTEQLAADLRALVADESVGSIVLNIDSPGGSVAGVPELADVIYQSRGRKPIVAVATSLAASAAYWLGSQADELVVTPSGEVGSIGVVAMHEDLTGAAEMEGVKPTIITAGKYKAELSPYRTLSEEARAALQARADDYYAMFTSAVARGRNVATTDVRAGFGEGRVVGAKQAVKLGMADRVATLDETVARLASGRSRIAGARAEDEVTTFAAWVAQHRGTTSDADPMGYFSDLPADEQEPDTDPDTQADTPPDMAQLELRRRRLRLLGR